MTIKNAAEKAMHLGKQLQAVVEVGKVLDEIGDLDNARIEAERDAKEADTAMQHAFDELSQVQTQVLTEKTDFERLKKESKEHVAEATARHDNIIAEARKERDALLAAANHSSEQRVAKANQEVNALQDTKDRLLKEITDAQKSVTNLENQMKALKERLG